MTTTNAPKPDAPMAYTVEEARKLLPQIGRNSFYAAIRKGDIPSVRCGGRILIPRAPFDRMFA